MDTPPTPIHSPAAAAGALAPGTVMPTDSILRTMLQTSQQVSDLIFSPGRPPQVKLSGQMTPVKIEGLPRLTGEDTSRIASDLIGKNKLAGEKLGREGSCDISYSLQGLSRFRANIFMQRGSCAIVMRVLPANIPDFSSYNLPSQLAAICDLKNGIVLITGPTGSGKSSTLAAIIDRINQEKAIHIVTIEDPIEFLHTHKQATIHQRELHSDTPGFSLGLRAALQQSAEVILVGEMRDAETIETALEAAETGHLVLSTLQTVDAFKTVERIMGLFPPGEQGSIRSRFVKAFRYIVSQQLIPRIGGGQVAAFEILTSTARTRECIEKGEQSGKKLVEAMRDGALDGMQDFGTVIEKLILDGIVNVEAGFGQFS